MEDNAPITEQAIPPAPQEPLPPKASLLLVLRDDGNIDFQVGGSFPTLCDILGLVKFASLKMDNVVIDQLGIDPIGTKILNQLNIIQSRVNAMISRSQAPGAR